MSAKNSAASATVAFPEREIVISRVFDAPREMVWEAWTNPKHIVNWWGPRGFTTSIEVMEVRPGGEWRHTMHGPDGTDYPNRSVFSEVVKSERIVFTNGGGKKGGRSVHFESTWTFEEVGDKTRVTIRMVFETAQEREWVVKEHHAIEGGNQTLARLEEFLPRLAGEADSSIKELVISREFAAPRDLVWKAWTDAKHLAQWWGPHGFTNPVCEVDLRPGGAILIHMRAPNGTVYPMKGTFEEIVAPERLVFLSGAMDETGKLLFEVRNTVTFAEQAGRTKLTMHAHVVSATDEAGRHLSGMEVGWMQSLERLEAFVAKG
jgi:uncharacterized protein YndB with AHSA1/START domain